MSEHFRFGRATAPPGPFTRLDPRTRLAILAAVLALAAFLKSPRSLGLLCLCTFVLPRLLGLPRGALRSLLGLAALPLAFTVLARFLYGPGASWLPRPSLAGLFAGLLHAMGFWISWCAFSLFWATTAPDDLLRALRTGRLRGGRFLEDTWLTLELALRFTPIMGEEAGRLVRAQTSRGVEWDGGLASRARRGAALVVPLIHAALRRAEGLADTLVARGFGSGDSTCAVDRRAGARDVAALGITAALAVVLGRLP